MPITRCPRCAHHPLLGHEPTCPRCGLDLEAIRQELDELKRPAIAFPPRVLPFRKP